jgi:hypothetical protein
VVRLSMANQHGHEFYIILPYEHGKAYRERKERALVLLDAAIEQGLSPGEVVELDLDEHRKHQAARGG